MLLPIFFLNVFLRLKCILYPVNYKYVFLHALLNDIIFCYSIYFSILYYNLSLQLSKTYSMKLTDTKCLRYTLYNLVYEYILNALRTIAFYNHRGVKNFLWNLSGKHRLYTPYIHILYTLHNNLHSFVNPLLSYIFLSTTIYHHAKIISILYVVQLY